MFKLMIALFAVSNGTLADRPSVLMTLNHEPFPTVEACQKFPETEEAKPMIDALKHMLAEKHGTMAARMACVKESKDDDGSI